MTKKFVPFLAHSELTNCIYIIDKDDKYDVTDQCIKAMEATNRMPNVDDVLDKIRAEIKALSPEPTAYDVVDGSPIKDAVWETLADVLKVIDKYKAESEDKDADSD